MDRCLGKDYDMIICFNNPLYQWTLGFLFVLVISIVISALLSSQLGLSSILVPKLDLVIVPPAPVINKLDQKNESE